MTAALNRGESRGNCGHPIIRSASGGFPANSATRCGVEVALQPVEVDFDIRLQADRDRILRAVDVPNLAEVLDDAFGEQKAASELRVMAGSPHSERNRFFAQVDFERLFDRQKILQRRRRFALDLPYRDCQDAAAHTDSIAVREARRGKRRLKAVRPGWGS